jgi:hypothetical protein
MQGLLNVVDASDPAAAGEFHQVSAYELGYKRPSLIFSRQLDLASYLTSLAISPSGSYIAAGDAEGAIHLLSQAPGDTTVPFNGFEGQPIPWVGPPEPLPEIDWSHSTCVSSSILPNHCPNKWVFIDP